MIALDEVPVWAIGFDGSGHAVASQNGPWVSTACGTLANFPIASPRPKAICKDCAKALSRMNWPRPSSNTTGDSNG